MIKIAYSNIEDLNITKGRKLVSAKRREKIDNFRFDKDKKLSCGAFLLLKKLLNDEGIINPKFKTTYFSKPYIGNYENIHFNLSHSGNMVLCGISDKNIGVDIEYIDNTIDLNIAKNYFYNNEYENIINSKKPTKEFFKYWVLKESFMKYVGLGFSLDLDNFNINIKNNNINVKIINENLVREQLKKDGIYQDILTNFKEKIENTVKFSLFEINKFKIGVASPYKVNKIKEINLNELYI